MKSAAVLILALAIVSTRAAAQAAAPIPSASVASDPIFSAPAASLTPQQIESLQQRLADWPQLDRYRADNEKLPVPVPGK